MAPVVRSTVMCAGFESHLPIELNKGDEQHEKAVSERNYIWAFFLIVPFLGAYSSNDLLSAHKLSIDTILSSLDLDCHQANRTK